MIIAVLLLAIFVFQSYSLKKRLSYYDAKLDDCKAQYEEEEKRTKEIEEVKEYMQTDEYIESVARDKLGLVKENEIVFKEVE